MKNDSKLEAIFEKNFMEGMIRKDYSAFKKSHKTLYNVILKTLSQIEELKLKPFGKILTLPVDDAFDKLANAVLEFKEANYYVDELQISCPDWYKKQIVAHASRYTFVSNAEPAKFMGIDFADGYENALIVSPKKGYKNVLKWQPERIELIII